MLATIRRISDTLVRVMLGVSMVLVAIMTVLVAVMVVTRYGFGFVLRGTEEMTLLLLLWTAMLGAAAVFRQREHIAVTFLLDRMPAQLRTIVQMVFSLLIVVYLAALTKYSVVHAINNIDNHTTALGISLFWAYSSIYVSSGFMLFFALLNIAEDIIKILTRRGE